MSGTHIHRLWLNASVTRQFAHAVSLHGHTLHSREFLDFIPKIAGQAPLLQAAVRQIRAIYRRSHAGEFDFDRAWWTPPLCVQRALNVERSQVEKLGLDPMISLTDHDTIDGAPQLRLRAGSRKNPVSVEWTVPFAETFFHLGVHNLHAGRERELMAAMRHCTANRGRDTRVLLEHLSADPGTLVVFNHPLWDEKQIGRARHREVARLFIERNGKWLHALELNGLRPWKENAEVAGLASEIGLPVISGGDRHGSEPAANLNLTNAASFAGFVDEIRVARRSEVLFLPHYRDSFRLRVMHTFCDVLSDHPEHPLGWARWSDRVFYRCDDGIERSFTELLGERVPDVVRHLLGIMRIAANPAIRSALRFAFAGRQELAL